MNADMLLEYYDRIADAPDAVARLRRFVLDLAVRGKLVPQDAGDEPAAVLLERIRELRTERVIAGELRKPKGVLLHQQSASLINIPALWTWCVADELWDFENGDRSSNYPSKDQLVAIGVPFINAGHLDGGSVNFSEMNYISEEKYLSLNSGKLKKGDHIYCLRGSLGKNAVYEIEGEAAIASSLVIMRPVYQDCTKYLSIFLDSDIALIQLKKFDNGTAQPNLSSANLRKYVIPLPPLAEQRRIVAKVDELMALCDQLEAARTAREETRDRMAAASLARLNNPDPETFPTDARFALNTLPALTTRPDQVKQFRQTILNLAVRGKLVAQDISGASNLATASEVDCLPAPWKYLRLRDFLIEDTQNGYSRRPDDASDGVPILRISAGTIRVDGVVAEEEFKRISGIDNETADKFKLNHGDLLACRFNGNKSFVGRIKIFKNYLNLSPIYPDKLIRFRVNHDMADPEYVRIAGDSDIVRAETESYCTTTVGNWGISASNLKEVRFPLPPLAEQRRIVAKVNELMALCDALESSLTAASTARARLLEATLQAALAPVEPLLNAAE